MVVLSAPGDRRDEDIRAIGRRAARSFDRFVLRADDDPRGRQPTEVPTLLREGLAAEGVSDDQIEVIPSEVEALDHALHMCQPGDTLLAFGDTITRCWKQIIYFGGRKPSDAVVAAAGDAGGGVYTNEEAPEPARPAPPVRHVHPTAEDERAEHGGVAPISVEAPSSAPVFVRDTRGVRIVEEPAD